jgi:hypothetical protein
MPRYKRTREEAELDIFLEPEVQPPQDVETLTKLRNMWEFASLMQYIFLFGQAVKIDDDLDIEVHSLHHPSITQYMNDRILKRWMLMTI